MKKTGEYYSAEKALKNCALFEYYLSENPSVKIKLEGLLSKAYQIAEEYKKAYLWGSIKAEGIPNVTKCNKIINLIQREFCKNGILFEYKDKDVKNYEGKVLTFKNLFLEIKKNASELFYIHELHNPKALL